VGGSYEGSDQETASFLAGFPLQNQAHRLNFSEAVYKSITMGLFKRKVSIQLFMDRT